MVKKYLLLFMGLFFACLYPLEAHADAMPDVIRYEELETLVKASSPQIQMEQAQYDSRLARYENAREEIMETRRLLREEAEDLEKNGDKDSAGQYRAQAKTLEDAAKDMDKQIRSAQGSQASTSQILSEPAGRRRQALRNQPGRVALALPSVKASWSRPATVNQTCRAPSMTSLARPGATTSMRPRPTPPGCSPASGPDLSRDSSVDMADLPRAGDAVNPSSRTTRPARSPGPELSAHRLAYGSGPLRSTPVHISSQQLDSTHECKIGTPCRGGVQIDPPA